MDYPHFRHHNDDQSAFSLLFKLPAKFGRDRQLLTLLHLHCPLQPVEPTKISFPFLYTRCQDRISLNLNWLAPFFHVFFLKFIKFKDNCISTVADIAAQNKITDVTHHFRKYGFHPFLQAERDLYVVAARNTAKFIAAS